MKHGIMGTGIVVCVAGILYHAFVDGGPYPLVTYAHNQLPGVAIGITFLGALIIVWGSNLKEEEEGK